jgi:hypothetical protein
MSGNTGQLRLRALVSSWFTVAVAVFLTLALVGGWAVFTVHAAPGTVVEQRQETHLTVDGEFRHSAEVTRENPVFETGETLSNRSTYFIGASPRLEGQYVATYSGTEGEPAEITLDPTLVIRATDGESVFWANRTSLAEPTTSSVENGDSAAVSFSLNASELAGRQTAIRNALGDSPGEMETYVAVGVTVEGTADGQPATLTVTHRLPVGIEGNAYVVGPAATDTEQFSTAESVSVPREYGLVWSAGGPLLLIAGLTGLGVLVVGRRRQAFELSPVERDLLAYLQERAEFDEWVVRMQLPDELSDRPRAEAASLADLVDFAIDSETGVVEDPEAGILAVVADDFLAVYEPPAAAWDASVADGSVLSLGPETAADSGSPAADGDDGEETAATESDATVVE